MVALEVIVRSETDRIVQVTDPPMKTLCRTSINRELEPREELSVSFSLQILVVRMPSELMELLNSIIKFLSSSFYDVFASGDIHQRRSLNK